MGDNKLEFISEYEKPIMEIIDISEEYAIVTSCGCDGSGGSPDPNEPGMAFDF